MKTMYYITATDDKGAVRYWISGLRGKMLSGVNGQVRFWTDLYYGIVEDQLEAAKEYCGSDYKVEIQKVVLK